MIQAHYLRLSTPGMHIIAGTRGNAMYKNDMIRRLLNGFESDRFIADKADEVDRVQINQAIQAELSRLSELTYREIEALYYSSTEDFACD
ncbi:MAG: hypothetical protein HY066_07175 [Betaproteobacteria bacterium]|nr:hypothetical protein [Betaproteobacteria bacterium]